jgi:hypothetical protein
MCDVRYGVIAVLLLSCISATGYAQTVSSYGMGSNSCGQYLAAVYGHPPATYGVVDVPGGKLFDQHALYKEWLLGFVTATNIWSLDAGTASDIKTDPPAMDVWMRKWCEQNPTKTVSAAAWAFIQDHRR